MNVDSLSCDSFRNISFCLFFWLFSSDNLFLGIKLYLVHSKTINIYNNQQIESCNKWIMILDSIYIYIYKEREREREREEERERKREREREKEKLYIYIYIYLIAGI